MAGHRCRKLRPAENWAIARRVRYQPCPLRYHEQKSDVRQTAALSIRIPTLQPEIKQIPPDTVNSKWVNLSQPAQEQVRGLFKSAERAVYMRARDEEKKAEAQFAVETLLQGVERKLPRFPFPPDTRDAHFDYEKLLGSNVSTYPDQIMTCCSII